MHAFLPHKCIAFVVIVVLLTIHTAVPAERVTEKSIGHNFDVFIIINNNKIVKLIKNHRCVPCTPN